MAFNPAITTILTNHQQEHAAVRFTATDTLALTDLAMPNTTIETITGLQISDIFWTGDWKITRNGNTIFQTANNTGTWNLATFGLSMTDQANSAITCTTAGTVSTLIITVAKQSVVLNPEV